MKFLVDAQLPRRLSNWLREQGYDSRHTLDLPEGNRTQDAEVVRVADQEGRIVVTKDDDFVRSHLLLEAPKSLLLISTGNVSNDELMRIFKASLPALKSAFSTTHFLELNAEVLIRH